MERPIGKRCQWDGLLDLERGAFRGAGRRSRFVSRGSSKGIPVSFPMGSRSANQCQLCEKMLVISGRNVFVSTEGMSIIGSCPLTMGYVQRYSKRHAACMAVDRGSSARS